MKTEGLLKILVLIGVILVIVWLAASCSPVQATPLRWKRLAHKCCSDGVCLAMRHHTRIVVEEQ